MVVGDLGPLRPCPSDGLTVCSGSLAGTPPPRTTTPTSKASILTDWGPVVA